MLRIGDRQVPGPSRVQITKIMDLPGINAIAIRGIAAPGADLLFEIAVNGDDLGLGQVFNTSNAFCRIRQVFTGPQTGNWRPRRGARSGSQFGLGLALGFRSVSSHGNTSSRLVLPQVYTQ